MKIINIGGLISFALLYVIVAAPTLCSAATIDMSVSVVERKPTDTINDFNFSGLNDPELIAFYEHSKKGTALDPEMNRSEDGSVKGATTGFEKVPEDSFLSKIWSKIIGLLESVFGVR